MENTENNGYYAEGEVVNVQSSTVEPPKTELEEPMTLGEWLVTMLLLCIPCANIVLMFVWAFSKDTKKSKSNFFKAYLIMMAIMIGIEVVLFVAFGAAAVAAFVAATAAS